MLWDLYSPYYKINNLRHFNEQGIIEIFIWRKNSQLAITIHRGTLHSLLALIRLASNKYKEKLPIGRAGISTIPDFYNFSINYRISYLDVHIFYNIYSNIQK